MYVFVLAVCLSVCPFVGRSVGLSVGLVCIFSFFFSFFFKKSTCKFLPCLAGWLSVLLDRSAC